MAILKSSPRFASALLALAVLSGVALAQIPPGAATSNVLNLDGSRDLNAVLEILPQ